MLTVPSKGTPLDLEFIGQLTDTVNTLQKQSATGSKFNSQIGQYGVSNANDVVFYANSISVSVNNPIAGEIKPIPFQFNSKGVSFKFKPYVTVGVNNSAGGAGDFVTAVVSKLNSESCTVNVVFNKGTSGNVTVEITVQAIGISPTANSTTIIGL